MSSVPGDFSYKTGAVQAFVPQFLPDTVVIRPYGEYGLYAGGMYTTLGGGYWVNANSFATDPNSGPMADIVYLVQNDLALLPNVKRVLIAVYWYTSLDYGNSSWGIVAGPAIGPEVQAWSWQGTAPPMWQAGPWTRSGAYWLSGNHKVWPTPADAALIEGIQYLESQGYQVGILPINALMSRNIYIANGGEAEVDRSILNWTQPSLTTFLGYYTQFIQHYIDLCAANNLRPWLFSIGSGMRDLQKVDKTTMHPQVIETFRYLLRYSKSKLPNTLTTYFADIDEYYYLYEVVYNPGYLDPLWTMPELDMIGVNWFAPLALDDSEDIATLTTNVFRGEGYSFYVPNIPWRSTQIQPDRVISVTTNTFRTGVGQGALNPRTNGCKNIEDWLVFNHYTPHIPGSLAGVTPPAATCSLDTKVSSAIQGTGHVLSDQTPFDPASGGIAPSPAINECYLQIATSDYCNFSTPASIPDDTLLTFAFDFALNVLQSDPTQSYRLFNAQMGLKIDVIEQVVTLQLPIGNHNYVTVPLFTFWSGRIDLNYTSSSVDVYVNNAFDQTVTPPSGQSFVLPIVKQLVWIGNQLPLPAGYSPWSGRVYYLKFLIGTGGNVSGGEFYFEDAYNGTRTAWKSPSPKPWMAITGYGSLHGTGADPFTRPEIIQWSGAASIVPSYEDAANLNAAVFWNNWHAVNIRGPYGSNFDIDEVYQANLLYCATRGLEPGGPEHIAAWFFDTRSPTAHLAKMPGTHWQIYGDAYDGEIDSSLNGKAAVRGSGVRLHYTPEITVDQMLGLSVQPGALPPVRSIITETGVPQA